MKGIQGKLWQAGYCSRLDIRAHCVCEMRIWNNALAWNGIGVAHRNPWHFSLFFLTCHGQRQPIGGVHVSNVLLVFSPWSNSAKVTIGARCISRLARLWWRALWQALLLDIPLVPIVWLFSGGTITKSERVLILMTHGLFRVQRSREYSHSKRTSWNTKTTIYIALSPITQPIWTCTMSISDKAVSSFHLLRNEIVNSNKYMVLFNLLARSNDGESSLFLDCCSHHAKGSH